MEATTQGDRETMRALALAEELESSAKQLRELARALRRHVQAPAPRGGVGSPLIHTAMVQLGSIAARIDRQTGSLRRLKQDLQVLNR